VLPETTTTVSQMVTNISRSLHNDTEFSKAKEVGITKQIWYCEQIATRFDLAQGLIRQFHNKKPNVYKQLPPEPSDFAGKILRD